MQMDPSFASFLTSEVVALQAEGSPRTFKIHLALLNDRSKVLAAAFENDLAEDDVFVCNDASDETVSRFVEWNYRNDYAVGPDTMMNYTTLHDMVRPGGPNASLVNGYTPRIEEHPLFSHLLVYIFADTYLVTGLKSVAYMKMSCSLRVWGHNIHSGYVEVIASVLTTASAQLHESDPLLEWLVYYAAWNIHALRTSSTLMNLIRTSPAICTRIINAMDPTGTSPWTSYVLRERMPEYMQGGFENVLDYIW